MIRLFIVAGTVLTVVASYLTVYQTTEYQTAPMESQLVKFQSEGLSPDPNAVTENEEVEHEIFEVPAEDARQLEMTMAQGGMNMGGMNMDGMNMGGGDGPKMKLNPDGTMMTNPDGSMVMEGDENTAMKMADDDSPKMKLNPDGTMMTNPDGSMVMEGDEKTTMKMAEDDSPKMKLNPDGTMMTNPDGSMVMEGDENTAMKMADDDGPKMKLNPDGTMMTNPDGSMVMEGDEKTAMKMTKAEEPGHGETAEAAPAHGEAEDAAPAPHGEDAADADPGHGAGASEAGLKIAEDGEFDREINLTMAEWGYSDFNIEVKTGERIRFNLKNDGQIPHEFMFMTMQAMMAVNYRAARADWSLLEHEALYEKSIVLPGGTFSFVATVEKDGAWMFMCMLPYHMQMGMMGQVATPGRAMEMNM